MNIDELRRVWESMTWAERSSDLELSQIRLERRQLFRELAEEGFTIGEQFEAWSEYLEEKLSRLYRDFYEREI